jgi:N-acetylneuraminate synthase
MAKPMKVGSRWIGPGYPPYVIAEIGVNHEGSLDQAMKLIELAKEGGADAAKFQSYKAENLASKDSPAYWDLSKEKTLSQFQLFKKYDSFGPSEYIALAKHCQKVGIDFLSTPFDDLAIEFLDPLVPFFKIASADLTNTPFLRRVASKGKPIVLSTGAATLAEIDQAIEQLLSAGCRNLALLHCILNYPTLNKNAHLRMISGLAHSFPMYNIGYSDHTMPDGFMTPLLASYLLGAVIIEKHFTHDKSLPGNDHYHAMNVDDLKRFTAGLKLVEELLGSKVLKGPIETEAISRKNARRSIFFSRPLPRGHVLESGDLTCKRPGTGVSPTQWDRILGTSLAKSVDQDQILQWSDLSDTQN